jgi:hypothetical protein
MSSSDPTGEVVEVLREAADEIGKLHALVNRRVHVLSKPWRPVSATVGELSDQLGISPRDALDEVIAEGVHTFWHEGTRFRSVDDLRHYLARGHYFDPVPEVEVDLTAHQVDRLATKWDLDDDTLSAESNESPQNAISADSSPNKPLRKFIASDSDLPGLAADRRKQQSG